MTKLTPQTKSDLKDFGFSLYRFKNNALGNPVYRVVLSNYFFEGVPYENRVEEAKAFITDPRTLNHDFGQTFWFPRQQQAECNSTIITFSATKPLQ